MTKNKLLYILAKNDDSIISIRLSKKDKDFIYKKEVEIYNKEQTGKYPTIRYYLDICCTTNFNNKYIKSLMKRKFNTNNNVLVFSWTENKFRLINPKDILSTIIPLSSILKNETKKDG